MTQADYPFQPIPFTQVAIRDDFWAVCQDREKHIAVEMGIPPAFRTNSSRILTFAGDGGVRIPEQIRRRRHGR